VRVILFLDRRNEGGLLSQFNAEWTIEMNLSFNNCNGLYETIGGLILIRITLLTKRQLHILELYS